MWKLIIEKLFCSHQWKSHAKNCYSSTPFQDNRVESTVEILICQKCGKIKQIMY